MEYKNSIKIIKNLLVIILIATSIILLFPQKSMAEPDITDSDLWSYDKSEDSTELTEISGKILEILNIIGIAVSVIGLVVIGIKIVVSSASGKSKYKEMLMLWLIGTILILVATTVPNIIYKHVKGNDSNKSGSTNDNIDKDADIYIEETPSSFTNGDVTINIKVSNKNFDHLVLPDGTKVTSTNCSYKVSKNGTYTFRVYDTYGHTTSKKATIKNIDTTPPRVGQCTAKYIDGKTELKLSASDTLSGIDKYEIDGATYKSTATTSGNVQDTIKLDGYREKTIIYIYDKAGNKTETTVTCKDTNIITSPEIKFATNYNSSSTVPYILYEPSITNSSTGLIVWLHGSGERNKGLGAIEIAGGLPKLLATGTFSNKFEGFNAYVLAPNLKRDNWSDIGAELYSLINEVVDSKKINKNKIVIIGHSLGADGAIYMANTYTDYFSAAVILSGYGGSLNNIKAKNLPIRGYTSNSDSENTRKYMSGYFKSTIGSATNLGNVVHGQIPEAAFGTKSDKYNQSELIVWMLSQDKSKR